MDGQSNQVADQVSTYFLPRINIRENIVSFFFVITIWYIFLGQTSLHAENPIPKLILESPSSHAFTYSKLQDGTLYSIPYKSESGRDLGVIIVWKSDSEDELTDLGDISALDKVLRGQILRLGADPTYKRMMEMVLPALGEYVKIHTGGYLLYPREVDYFLDQMKPHVSTSVYAILSDRLVYKNEVISDDSWVWPFFVLKADGSIELHRFSGSLSPFSMDKKEAEVIVKAGVIPISLYKMKPVE